MAGRPPYKPTDEARAEVLRLIGLGCTQRYIASVLKISLPTLEQYYREELDEGAEQANGVVAGNLYKLATQWPPMQGTPAAMMFWLKTRARWRETDKQEGEENKPLTIVIKGGLPDET